MCWNISGLILVFRTTYFSLKLSGLYLWGKEEKTTLVFEGALKQRITKHMLVSSKVMEREHSLQHLACAEVLRVNK